MRIGLGYFVFGLLFISRGWRALAHGAPPKLGYGLIACGAFMVAHGAFFIYMFWRIKRRPRA